MVLLVNYGMGNIESLSKALKKIKVDFIYSDKKEDFDKASHIILPGVGNFGEAIRNLKRKIIDEYLNENVILKKKPFLGICLGMQLLFEKSEESNEVSGLGYLKGNVSKFNFEESSFKTPHVGWNEISYINSQTKLLEGIKKNSDYYFVHSYKINDTIESAVKGFTNHGTDFISFIQKKNIIGVQFHPEKSQISGLKLLDNFSKWNGSC